MHQASPQVSALLHFCDRFLFIRWTAIDEAIAPTNEMTNKMSKKSSKLITRLPVVMIFTPKWLLMPCTWLSGVEDLEIRRCAFRSGLSIHQS